MEVRKSKHEALARKSMLDQELKENLKKTYQDKMGLED